MNNKAKALIAATFILASAGGGYYRWARSSDPCLTFRDPTVGRVCISVDAELPCKVVELCGTDAMKAKACQGKRQARLWITAKKAEARLSPRQMIETAKQATSWKRSDGQRKMLNFINTFSDAKNETVDGPCPVQRILVKPLDSPCIGGSVKKATQNDDRTWSVVRYFGQCCGVGCSCQSGGCCTTVAESELAGGGAFQSQVCADCPQLARCIDG